jgi:hypothetical protein
MAWPIAQKFGDPHSYHCGCGHKWVAPLDFETPCPSCTDEHGRNWLDRQTICIAQDVVKRFGIEVAPEGQRAHQAIRRALELLSDRKSMTAKELASVREVLRAGLEN